MTQTTPVNAWPYPESTDAPNGAAQMQALALAIETTMTAVKAFWAPIVKVKTGPTNYAGTVVVADDSELFVDLVAGRTYKVDALIQATGTAAGDLRVVWSNTGAMTFPVVRHCMGPTVDTSDVLVTTAGTPVTTKGVNVSVVRTLTTEVVYGVDGSASSSIRETFHVACTVSGRLQMRFAQAVASGTTTVSANSSIVAVPLS